MSLQSDRWSAQAVLTLTNFRGWLASTTRALSIASSTTLSI